MAIKLTVSVLCLFVASATGASSEPVLEAVRGIERDLGARVGFYMHDLHTDEQITYAAHARFPMNSTFKLLACGALLKRVEAGEADLTQTVSLQGMEVVSYSPAIKEHMRKGKRAVSLNDACGMVLSVSDNTAANIVLSQIGGPDGLTTFLRSVGDENTRLDRWEPAMNEATPGDPRDTTTPHAIANSVGELILGSTLSTTSRSTLRGWLSHHSVANALFRAALPPSWTIDDRSGAGGFGSRSIVAVLYPPNRKPILAALFMTETNASFTHRNASIARVGAAIVAHTSEN
ncbi:class A beta-lactamase [Litoreibacter albidus]|uniref:class A beta-lactamase n=1 Tax=Litoreibacter albidus TaxID=670155 RepID=UPI003734CD69